VKEYNVSCGNQGIKQSYSDCKERIVVRRRDTGRREGEKKKKVTYHEASQAPTPIQT